jgi:hypothetical protein
MFDKRIKIVNLLSVIQIIFIAPQLCHFVLLRGWKVIFFENFDKKKYLKHNINVNKNNFYININVD